MIGIRMAITLFTQSAGQLILLIALAGAAVFAAVYHHRHPSAETKHLMQDVLFGVGCFAVWLIMIYAMYVFSMPISEAKVLASYDRYTLTGLLFSCGIASVFLLEALDCDVIEVSVRLQYVKGAASVVMAALLIWNVGNYTLVTDTDDIYPEYNVVPADETLKKRSRMLSVKKEQNLPNGGDYCVYIGRMAPGDDVYASVFRNVIRHDFVTQDVNVLYYSDTNESFAVRDADGTQNLENIDEWIKENAPKMDGIIFIEENDELIEKARSAAPGRVYAAWEESEESDSEMKRPVQVCLHRTILT